MQPASWIMGLLVVLGLAAQGADVEKLDPQLVFLRKKYADVEERVAIPKDGKEFIGCIEKTVSQERVSALGIYAMFVAKTLGDCDSAIAVFRPIVLSTEGQKKKDAKNVDANILNQITLWKKDKQGVVAALWIARILVERGDIAKAAEIIEAYKQEFTASPEFQGVAAGLYGDIALKTKRFSDAVRFLEAAESVLDGQLKEYGATSYAVNFAMDHVRRVIPEARKLREVEEFGPAWSAYREADYARLIQRDYPEAYRRYRIVVEKYPGTIYADAAQAYAIRALFRFSTDDTTEAFQRKLAKCQERMAILMKTLEDLTKNKVGKSSLEEQQQALIEQRSVMEELQRFPLTGAVAAAEAMRQSNAFIAQDPLGMYRGEVFESIGDWWLEDKVNVAEAKRQYEKAYNWYNSISSRDKNIGEDLIEARVKRVAAPPLNMRKIDEWGNSEFSIPVPGQLINHRTAEWYVPFHRMMTSLKSGMCSFICGDIQAAIGSTEVILEIDEQEKNKSLRGMPNLYNRLRSDYKETRMFATRDELAAFSGESSVRMLVAEFYFEVEDWKRAREMYQNINRKFSASLKPDAKTYLDFQIANCGLWIEDNRDDNLNKIRKLVEDNPKAISWARMQMALASMVQSSQDGCAESRIRLDAVIKKCYGTRVAMDALLFKAKILFFNGRKQEGLILLTMLEDKFGGTFYATAATGFMKEYSQ